MARTGQQQDTRQSNTDYQQQNSAFDTGQTAIGQVNKNIATLDSGGNVAADPWMSARYLGNVNRLQAGALNSATNAGKDAIQGLNRRTGGMNSTAAYGATRDLTLGKARLADQLSSERAAQDYNKNVDYQTRMAMMPLAVAGAESPYYGTASSGQSSANSDLTQLGLASYAPYTAALQALGGGLSTALGKFVPNSQSGGSGGGGGGSSEA